MACEQLGVASRALSMAVAYAKTRMQFGRPIGSFQAVKHRCVDMAQRVEAARSATQWAVAALAGNSENVGIATAMASVCSAEAAVFATAENVHGPRRYRFHLGAPGAPLLPASTVQRSASRQRRRRSRAASTETGGLR